MNEYTLNIAYRVPANQTSYNTGSIVIGAGRVVFLMTIGDADSGGTTNVPTVSGLGVTWTLIDSQIYAGNARLAFFWAYVPNGATGAVVVDWGGQSQRYGRICIFSGTNIVGGNPVVQSAKNAAIATSLTVTLPSAFRSSLNSTVGVFAMEDSGDGIVVGSGYTLLFGDSNADHNMGAEYKVTNDTTVDINKDGSGTAPFAGIAIEVNHVQDGGFLLNFV